MKNILVFCKIPSHNLSSSFKFNYILTGVYKAPLIYFQKLPDSLLPFPPIPFVELGIEPRASHLLGNSCTIEPPLRPDFNFLT